MTNTLFDNRLKEIKDQHSALITKSNTKLFSVNGVYKRYENPIVTRDHLPLDWRFDLNKESNPFLMERIGFNATLNSVARRSRTLPTGPRAAPFRYYTSPSSSERGEGFR